MLLALTTLVAHPGQQLAFVDAGMIAVERIRAEPGCTGCRLLHNVAGDGTFVVVEEWASMAQLRRHLRGEAYRRMLTFMEMSARPCPVAFHTIRSTKGMELVHKVLACADEAPL